jgi:hypothetical protein
VANETVLDLITRVNIEPLNAGMEQAASKVASSSGEMAANFAKLDAATTASIDGLKGSIDSLSGKLELMTEQVSAAMSKITSSIARGTAESGLELGELKSRFADVGREAEISATGIGNIYGGFGALLGLGAIGAFLGSIVDGLDKFAIRIHKFSEETAISTDRVQEFEAAMEILHVAPEQAELALLRLNRSLTLAAEGSQTQSQLFQRLGVDISAWKSGQLDLIGVLEQIQKVTSDNISVNERQGITMQVAGRNAKDFALVLGITSEQFESLLNVVKEFGGVVSPQAIDSFVRMSQEMTLLWTVVKTQLAEAFVSLLPVIKFAIVAISEMAFYVKVLIEVLGGLFVSILEVGNALVGVVQIMVGDWEDGVARMKKSAHDFADNWRGAANDIVASNARASGLAQILFSDSVDKMLGDLSKLREGGSEDILSGITGGSRVEEFKEQLEEMRSQADAFHGLQLEDERQFWQNILDTQRLSAKDRAEVERELNNTLHKIAVEHYQEQIALDQEFIKTSIAGSEERKFAVQKERDDTVDAYGEGSKQAIEANMKVLENQVENDKIAAGDVQKSVEQQVESYKAGSQERINLMAAAIATIKTMQDNVVSGKTAGGGPTPEAPVGPTEQADAQLRVQIRQTESADIEKIITALQAKLAEEYRSETTEVQHEALEQERIRMETSEKATQLAIGDAQRSSQEQVKEVERLAQYDVITFSQKIQMLRQISDAEHQKGTAAVNAAIAEAQAEQSLATTDAEREAAIKRIIALKEELAKLDQQYGQQAINISDQVAQREEQNAERAASVISSSFQQAFGKLLTQHTNLLSVMTKFWDDMVVGWARMGLQIVAQYVQNLAQIVLREILTQTQITAVDSTAMTTRQATQNLWQSFLQALGIKTVSQSTTTEAQETAAHTAGVNTRKAADTVASTQTQAMELQQVTQFTTFETQETAAHAAGIAARAAADTAGNTASLAATIAKNIATITSEAGVAGAAAFASVMAALPFPVNVATAPGVMAAAIATTLGNLGLASAAGGMEVTRDQLVKVHENETILPANISQGFKNIISGSAGPGGAGGPGGPGGAGGPSHVTYSPHIEYHSHGDSGIQKEELGGLIMRAIRMGEVG